MPKEHQIKKKIKIQFMKIAMDNVFFFYFSSLINCFSVVIFFSYDFWRDFVFVFPPSVFFYSGHSLYRYVLWYYLNTQRFTVGFFLICCILVFLFTCMLAPNNYRDILNIYTLSPSPTTIVYKQCIRHKKYHDFQ